jgi:hypothetical protein
MSATGTGTRKGFIEASPEQLKHLLDTHLRIFIEQTTGEVYVTYGLDCKPKDPKCPCPGKVITFRMCPTSPCIP